jgi:hypothetical protein
MPQVRLLAPWTNAKGEPQASGAVIDVSDDEARDLSARGHASLLEEEKKLEQQQATSAVYNDRLTRESAPAAVPVAEETAPPPA